MLVILAMSTLSLISLSIKDATDRASKETFANITNSFSMEINRQVNPGTPRGGGNVKGEDIKKISQTDSIDSYVKRINSVADLVDYHCLCMRLQQADVQVNIRRHFRGHFERILCISIVGNFNPFTLQNG